MGNHEYCVDCGESDFHYGRDCDPKKKAAMAATEASRTARAPVGVSRIAAERDRQIAVEGWAPEHDDEHDTGELVRAARILLNVLVRPPRCKPTIDMWGLVEKHWKDPLRCLEIAGALIAAEIDRRVRAAAPESQANGDE